ncbi:hypothetical protein [Streptomyces syringium]
MGFTLPGTGTASAQATAHDTVVDTQPAGFVDLAAQVSDDGSAS